METNNIDNPPAFARPDWNPGYRDQAQKGMSLRDYFAAKVDTKSLLDGISVSTVEALTNSKRPSDPVETYMWWLEVESKIQYMKADAMLKARQTTNKEQGITMKKIIKNTLILICSMLVVFLISNALGYWYECGKSMCYWDQRTRDCVVWFTIVTGMINGFANLVIGANKAMEGN